MKNHNPEDKNQHYYAACAFGWVVDESLFQVIEKLKREFGSEFPNKKMFACVYHVPLPISDNYEIYFFAPKVKDATLIFQGRAVQLAGK